MRNIKPAALEQRGPAGRESLREEVTVNQTKERNGAMKKLGKTVAAAVLAAAVLSTCALAQEAGISEAPPAAPAFTDVAADAYYADAAVWAVEQGITAGKTQSLFAPNETCTTA